MRRGAFVALAFLFAAGVSEGQEPAPCNEEAPAAEVETCPVPSDEEAEPAVEYDNRPQIQVLQHPYDLASFYRADGQQPGFYERAAGRYPISSYYRGAVSARGYSRFWTTGYGPRLPVAVPFAGPGAVRGLDYRNRIGENGDLFLMAPILAPIGPLSDVFFSVDLR